jgi:hypothetical protein
MVDFDFELHRSFRHAIIRLIRRDYYLELTMSAYVPALIWLLSGLACGLIAKRRLLKRSVIRDLTVALTGPFAIPWVLVAKPSKAWPRDPL